MALSCFKTYDIRGKLGCEIDEHISYRIGRACAQSLGAKNIVVGYDARETSPVFAKSLIDGIRDVGSNIFEIGLSGTEEMYWAVTELNADAGIEVTASHNPINYNGMKIVKSGSRPLTRKEFFDIKVLVEENNFPVKTGFGLLYDKKDKARDAYIKKILSFIDEEKLRPLKIVINSGNGAAGPVIDALQQEFIDRDVESNFVLVNHLPDSSFPNGIPNPLIEENRPATADIVKKENADFGVAFDGDFDRCFLFDHLGNIIAGEYVVGLLSEIFLAKHRGSKIIHDPRVIWNIRDVVKHSKGHAIASKTGHAFIKTAMRKENAVYGGEMSAHHYFRDFAYCDSGMIPWLLIWEFLSQCEVSLADLITKRKVLFPSSGEINFKVKDPLLCIDSVKNSFIDRAKECEEIDGVSLLFDDWRFNIRKSNTEPLVRLNVETKGNRSLLVARLRELETLIKRT